MENSQKWLGEGAKGLLGQGRQRPLARVQNRVAPVQNRVLVVQKTLGRPLLPGSKTPFAPSPNHFWEFSIFRPLWQALGVATMVWEFYLWVLQQTYIILM